MRSGDVYITEDWDAEDFLTGRFSASWTSGRGDGPWARGPCGVSAEEAIAWGRERAPVVVLRVGEGAHYSAGDEQPREELPPWPSDGIELGRRRHPAMAHLDRTESDPPILWDARISSVCPDGRAGDYAEAFGRQVAADPVATGAIWRERVGADAPMAEAAFKLNARTTDEAEEIAGDVLHRACAAAARAVGGDWPGLGWSGGIEVYPAEPGPTRWPRGNASGRVF